MAYTGLGCKTLLGPKRRQGNNKKIRVSTRHRNIVLIRNFCSGRSKREGSRNRKSRGEKENRGAVANLQNPSSESEIHL